LEFSFDRSNEQSPPRETTQAKPEPQSTATHSDGIDTSTITNERLRKAIEKNRARQAERNRTHPMPQAAAAREEVQSEMPFERQAPPNRPHASERIHTTGTTTSTPRATTVVTRRNTARPDEADFTPVKRTTRKVAEKVTYTTTSRKKSKPMDPVLSGYLVKGCWIFCAVMILRLIFANGGVTDFYSQRSFHNENLNQLNQIKKENMQLVQEIERMQSDASFQKKLVRDNLGFIAADEFLVLFPKETVVQ
jgi:cell division protein FtsB